MRKIDGITAALIGFINGVFFFFILKQMNIVSPYLILLPIIFPFLALFGMFVVSEIGKKLLFIFQLAKFFLVGTLNTFVDLGVLNILMAITRIYSGGIYPVFKGISFLVATTNSYFWNKYWTFEKKEEKPKPQEFLKFLIVTAVGLLLDVTVASIVVNIIGPQGGISVASWATVGAIAGAIFAFLWNFTGAKFIVFKK